MRVYLASERRPSPSRGLVRPYSSQSKPVERKFCTRLLSSEIRAASCCPSFRMSRKSITRVRSHLRPVHPEKHRPLPNLLKSVRRQHQRTIDARILEHGVKTRSDISMVSAVHGVSLFRREREVHADEGQMKHMR